MSCVWRRKANWGKHVGICTLCIYVLHTSSAYLASGTYMVVWNGKRGLDAAMEDLLRMSFGVFGQCLAGVMDFM